MNKPSHEHHASEMHLPLSHWQRLPRPDLFSRFGWLRLVIITIVLLPLILFVPIPHVQNNRIFWEPSLLRRWQNQVPPVPLETSKAQENTPVSATSKNGWKTITYEEQGFSFQYPPDRISPDYPESCFRNMKPDEGSWENEFWVRMHSGTNEIDLEDEWVKRCEVPGEDGGQFEVRITKEEHDIQQKLQASDQVEYRNMLIGGQVGTIINFNTRGGESGLRIYFNRNGYGYFIYIPQGNSGSGTAMAPVFEEILSTFTFTNP